MNQDIRIMTYNVRSCTGMDGKTSPFRIAEVIAAYNPDIVALQELDVKRIRTGVVDQPMVISESLKMFFHFAASLELEEEQYGNAILSRFPMRLKNAGALPTLPYRTDLERRSALWAAVFVGGRELQIINTHLGLRLTERLAQAKALVGPDWLGSPACRTPLILCGDLNSLPVSPVYRRLSRITRDVQRSVKGKRPKKTWPGFLPFYRIDHIFYSPEFAVRDFAVPRTKLTRIASDHLPLIAEMSLLE